MKKETFWEAARSVRFFRAILFGVLLACTGYAFAQTGNGSIAGTVTDPQGAVVSSANIKVTQINTGIARTVTTNGAGQFNVPSLPPATYSVTVEAQGFKSYEQNIVLLADQIRDMDVKLEVGATHAARHGRNLGGAGQHHHPNARPGHRAIASGGYSSQWQKRG